MSATRTFRAILTTGTARWPRCDEQQHELVVSVPEGANEMASLDDAARVAGINHFLVKTWEEV